MKLRADYTLTFLSGVPGAVRMPYEGEVLGNLLTIGSVEGSPPRAFAAAECDISLDQLRLHEPRAFAGIEIEETPAIEIVGRSSTREFLNSMIHALAFLSDMPIHYSVRGESLVPESPADHAFLENCGTRLVYPFLSLDPFPRTFHLKNLTPAFLATLISREPALAMYAHALAHGDSSAQYRELWRILELAFYAKKDALTTLLAQFQPAKEMEFTLVELKELMTLRGRAGHLYSRKAREEHENVLRATGRKLGRLKCLVERVILAKKNWEESDVEFEELVPLDAYVNPSGDLTILR